MGVAGTASLGDAFNPWGQHALVTVSSGETALFPLCPGLGKKCPEDPWSVVDPPLSPGGLRLRPFACLPC